MAAISPPSGARELAAGAGSGTVLFPAGAQVLPAPARPREGDRCHLPEKKAVLADVHASDVSLPLRFFVLGILSLISGTVLLAARPDLLATYHYNQHVIAATHLLVLGWLATMVMGATYQLVPVALETKLHSPRLVRWHFLLHAFGVPGMVWMFWVWDMKQVGHFGAAVALGMFLFIYNIARTLRRAPRRNAVWLGVASALAWLAFTALAGLYVVAAKCWDFTPFNHLSQMHAHAHLGVLGFFVMMLVGVSYKLVPMFALGEVQDERRARRSVWLLNAGVAAVFLTVLLDLPWKTLAALPVLAGLATNGAELAAIVRARKRRELDLSLRCFLAGLALLAPVAGLGLILSWPGLPLNAVTGQLENVYGLLAVLGVVSLAVLGMMHKIVPFLVWYRAYSRSVGRFKVPALAELFSARLQAVALGVYAAGLAVTTLATALGHPHCVRIGCGLLSLGAVLFATNFGLVFQHLVRPRLQPLAVRATLP